MLSHSKVKLIDSISQKVELFLNRFLKSKCLFDVIQFYFLISFLLYFQKIFKYQGISS